MHIEDTFRNGANLYFPKPSSYKDLKTITQKIFDLNWADYIKPQKERFILTIHPL